MRAEFIPYNEALALKELGFDEPCIASYTNIARNIEFCYEKKPTKYSKIFVGKNLHCVTPTFSQAFRWFRDKYDLRIWIESKSPILFEYTIATSNAVFLNMVFEDNSFYGTYEEAELECLKKLIEIVKEKK